MKKIILATLISVMVSMNAFSGATDIKVIQRNGTDTGDVEFLLPLGQDNRPSILYSTNEPRSLVLGDGLEVESDVLNTKNVPQTAVIDLIESLAGKQTAHTGLSDYADFFDTDWRTAENKIFARGSSGEQFLLPFTNFTRDLLAEADGDGVLGLIATGSTSEYIRGDGAYTTLDKSAVGLGNLDNTSDANKPVSTAQQTALDAKVATTRTVNGHALSSNVTVTVSDLSLGNVNNTSDANKPVSTATQTALDAKQNTLTQQGAVTDGAVDAATNAATNASTSLATNYNLATGLLGLATAMNDANTAQNDLATKYNALAVKYNEASTKQNEAITKLNSLLAKLRSRGTIAS